MTPKRNKPKKQGTRKHKSTEKIKRTAKKLRNEQEEKKHCQITTDM